MSKRKPKPNPKYRIDPNRSIYVIGEFGDQLLAGAIPAITALRADQKKPIGVVINSFGGGIYCLDALVAALGVASPDGVTSRVVTMVMGQALSAGAMLLVLGDYAIATSGSMLLFHGLRQDRYEVTVERAFEMATDMSSKNHELAGHMAQVMIPRIMHRFARLKPRIPELRKSLNKPNLSLVDCFAQLVMQKTSDGADKVIKSAIKHIEYVRKVRTVLDKITLNKGPQFKNDAKILTALVNTKLKENKNQSGWRLYPPAANDIVADYTILWDFIFGNHRGTLQDIVTVYGPEFLDRGELKKIKLMKSQKKKMDFIIKSIFADVEEFWYFTVSLARILFHGENTLTAIDAYWMGLIDEIQGDEEYYGLRKMMEG